MKKLLAFCLVLATVLLTPISAAADTAEVTAVRYGNENNNPNTADLVNISDYMILFAVSGTAIVLIMRRWCNETD